MITQGLYQFGSNLFAAWKGEVGDDRLFYAKFDGTSWKSETVHIPGNSSVGPSLASPNANQLFAIWKGENSANDQRIFYSIYTNGAWQNQVQVEGWVSSMGPSLGVVGDILYAAFKGGDGDNQIYWSQWTGSGWSTKQAIPGATSVVGPSLAGMGTQLYVGWVGLGGPGLQFLQFDGSNWTAVPAIPGNPGSNVGVSLASLGNSLYAAWNGEGTDQGIYYSIFTNGSWVWQIPVTGVSSSNGAALAAYGTKVYAMWTGPGNDQNLNYAIVTNNGWTDQNTLPGNSGQDNALPPYGGLSSSSNYLMGSGNCANLANPTVTITINEPLIVQPGVQNFGFQLNCYSSGSGPIAWQQYLIVPRFDSGQVTYGFQGWGNGNTGHGGLLIDDAPAPSLASISNGTIPAKWVMTFVLKTDSNGNIYEAEFSVNDPSRSPTLVQKSIARSTNPAPIAAMQLNIVGPSGGTTTNVFQSGAGTIVYSGSNQLSALRAVPSCAEVSNPTGEISNISYSEIPVNGTLVQSFGVIPG
ncbi:MAG: hypothetical protein WBP85_15445 [Terracidiphilus sp.]